MDNLTHSIAGLLMAHAAVQLREVRGERASRAFAVAAAAISVVGSNLPDLDFVYVGITPGKLGYLLHHRGHTHTVVGAFGATLLLLGGLWFVERIARRARARELTRPGDGAWLLALALATPLLHIAMDYSNNYGVHPFWPLDNRWRYGDSVFIIEPWYWVFAVPALAITTGSWVLRVVLGLVLLTGLGLAWALPFVSWGTALTLTLAAVASALAALKLRAPVRTSFAIAACLGVTIVFAGASRAAYARTQAAAGGPIQDAILTPGPGNPLCFGAIVIDTPGEDYRLRVAAIATVPALLSADACRLDYWRSDLPMKAIERTAPDRRVHWVLEWRAPLSELREIHASNCEVAAFLRFARAPYWFSVGRDTLQIGDLRYDRDGDLGFAELQVRRHPTVCPPWVPPWVPPRGDVLTPAAR